MATPTGKQEICTQSRTSLRAFGAIDNDLAIENMENDFDMTAADLQDLGRQDV